MADEDSFDIIETRSIHRGFHCLEEVTLRQRRVDGSWTRPLSRELYRHRPSAAILLHDPLAGKVVLIEQPRLPAHAAGLPDRVIQVVAGMVDDGETPEGAVIRETREEAGLALLGEALPVHRIMPSPGAVSELSTLFYGEVDATKAPLSGGLTDEEEETRVLVMQVAEMMRAIEQGRIFDGMTVLLGWWLQAALLSGRIRTAGRLADDRLRR